MYHIYHTRGLVIERVQRGEQDLVVSILTDDPMLGLVRARATSGASTFSRMRAALEPLTEGRYAFVRGRFQWRLIGAQANRWFAPQVVQRANQRIAGPFARFLVDIMPSEGMVPPEVVHIARDLVVSAARADALPSETLHQAVARVLHALGYLPSPRLAREGQVASALWAAGIPHAVYYLYGRPATAKRQFVFGS
ncbi:MAG: hypothetical protein KatS3mg100_051 [Candidatus Parcubacteria bacterium]|nr:MAG: hypothetical protein KatS3mg100_051 [Candidatus Parcubacteria bacterium]